MAAAVLDIEPKLVEQAEKVFNRSGFSYPEFVRNITEKAIMDLSRPEELPVPCIDDMTEEEFDAILQDAFDEVKAGHTYTADEVEAELGERYAVAL
ncbi:MAG: hypothetical protein IJU31_02770 [Synergistaceae bacterium]|nr:hypothetical protein [Synergistaceae bacterium]